MSSAKIDNAYRLPRRRRRKGSGGSPEPPAADVTTRIAGDCGQSPLPCGVVAGVTDPGEAATGRAMGR